MSTNAATRFKPGALWRGNPGGRPIAAAAVTAEAKRFAIEMVHVLVKLARTAQAESVRKAAAAEVLDRAVGKAPQAIDHTVVKDISRMSLEELRELEQRMVGAGLAAITPPDDSSQPRRPACRRGRRGFGTARDARSRPD